MSLVCRLHWSTYLITPFPCFQPKITPDEFKAKALPLHVMLTHTPPSILKEGLIEEDGTEEKSPPVAESATNDIGLVGSLTLVPSSFSTGSYGWKGSKRVTVELQAGEVGPDGTREKVQVMLSYVCSVHESVLIAHCTIRHVAGLMQLYWEANQKRRGPKARRKTTPRTTVANRLKATQQKSKRSRMPNN